MSNPASPYEFAGRSPQGAFGEVVLVHREPIGDTYQELQVVRRYEPIKPIAFAGSGVPVASILG